MTVTTITFEGRSPKPHTIAIGMQGEHNAETIRLEGLPEFGTAVLNVVLPDGTGDLMTITDGTVTFTRNQTQNGTMTAWVTVQDGTDIVWKSEKMYLAVGELPEIDGPVEQRYPGYVEDTIAEMTEIASQTVAAKDAVFGMSAEAQTLPAGESATASYSQGVMHFGIPTGPKGDAFTYSDFTQEQLAALTGPQGPDGHTPSFSIGTVESGASAAATITGTDADPILNLTLPKGDKGENGVPANIGVGSVTTGEPGTDADVTISGTGEAGYELNFTIPRGTPGAGNVSEVRGEKGLTGTVTSSGALKADLKDETKFVNASLNPKETTTRMYPVSLDSNGKLVCSVPYPTYAAGAGLDAIYSIPVPATIVTPEGTRQYYTSTQDVTFNLDVSGATAGTYGPAWDVTGENGSTINVPQITVDQYGRVTSINNKILTCVDTQGDSLPSGGYTGQVLRKASNTARDVEWSGYTVPAGGDIGMVLAKATGNAGETTWKTVREIPSGGSSGQILAKSSNTDYAVSWVAKPTGVPTGGTTGQVLAKSSNSDGALTWKTISTIPNGNHDAMTVLIDGLSGPVFDNPAVHTEMYAFYDDPNYYVINDYVTTTLYDMWYCGRPLMIFMEHDNDPDYDPNYMEPFVVTFAVLDHDTQKVTFRMERVRPNGTMQTRTFRMFYSTQYLDNIIEAITT